MPGPTDTRGRVCVVLLHVHVAAVPAPQAYGAVTVVHVGVDRVACAHGTHGQRCTTHTHTHNCQ